MTAPPDLEGFSTEEIIEALDEVRLPFDICLVGSDNYFNGGAVVRILHSFLGRKLHLVDVPKIYKRACMSTYKYEKNNIVHYSSCDEFDEYVQLNKRNLVVFERRWGLETKSLCTFSYPENPILVFGSEKFGVPDRYLTGTNVVSIPMLGIQNDLNLACAVGIVCYDFINKYMKST